MAQNWDMDALRHVFTVRVSYAAWWCQHDLFFRLLMTFFIDDLFYWWPFLGPFADRILRSLVGQAGNHLVRFLNPLALEVRRGPCLATIQPVLLQRLRLWNAASESQFFLKPITQPVPKVCFLASDYLEIESLESKVWSLESLDSGVSGSLATPTAEDWLSLANATAAGRFHKIKTKLFSEFNCWQS